MRIDRPGTLGEVPRVLDEDAEDEIDEGVASPEVWPGGRRVAV